VGGSEKKARIFGISYISVQRGGGKKHKGGKKGVRSEYKWTESAGRAYMRIWTTNVGSRGERGVTKTVLERTGRRCKSKHGTSGRRQGPPQEGKKPVVKPGPAARHIKGEKPEIRAPEGRGAGKTKKGKNPKRIQKNTHAANNTRQRPISQGE